jgi:CheY-like chemotaxis protein
MTSKNVMIVDDDEDLRQLIAGALTKHGCSVTQAANGQEALAIVDRDMPALIILDMVMPVMDGWEFAKRFYRDHDGSAPIIVLTAGDPEGRAHDIGSKWSIGKPIKMDRLLSMVDGLTAH